MCHPVRALISPRLSKASWRERRLLSSQLFISWESFLCRKSFLRHPKKKRFYVKSSSINISRAFFHPANSLALMHTRWLPSLSKLYVCFNTRRTVSGKRARRKINFINLFCKYSLFPLPVSLCKYVFCKWSNFLLSSRGKTNNKFQFFSIPFMCCEWVSCGRWK